jgi:ABC-type sugar transport system ATPase subunit
MAFLELHSVNKRFGPVRALLNARLEVEQGEIHAVVGENGSGKTTLMRILNGDLTADSGDMTLDGQPFSWTRPAAARAAGIGVVYQEPNLSPDLTVAENVFMGQLPNRWGRVEWRQMSRRFTELAADTGITLSSRTRVRDLSPDRRQLVEIAKVVAARPRLIALDEPTASLTEDQVELLFSLLRRFRDEGRAVIFISHRLREIFTLCDRATVLRDGETRSTLKVEDADEDEIIRLMVGRELAKVHRTPNEPGARALEVRSLTRGQTLRNIHLHVRRGEIVGIAGLVGAGRSALFRTLVGLRQPDTAEVLVDLAPVCIRSPRDAIGAGMALVPEDRRLSGLCLDMSITENIALVEYARRALASVVNRSEAQQRAKRLMEDLAIRARGHESKVRTLSGGNQQKVVLARWLAREPKILLLDEPTRGIDVGAKAEIYQLLDRLVARGVALLVSSSELPELLTLCDRIYAMYRGELVAEFDRANATEEALARAISGTLAA